MIARLAAAQHGAVGRKQLLEAGLSRNVVDHRRDKGLLVVVHPGVYRLAGCTPTSHQRIMAAILAAGPGAVASHRAAGFLHRLAGIDVRTEVTVARRRAPRSEGLVVHRLASLSARDVEVRDGIARTRPAVTIIDLAAVVPEPRLEAALDDALMRGLVSCGQLERRLDALGHQGRKGTAVIGHMLAARRGRPRWTQSEFERHLFSLLRRAGVPLPVPQFEVVLPHGRRAFLDFAWPDLRLALEADSYRHHAGRLAWARDHTRNTVLVSIGWRIVPVTWEDLVATPEELVTLVRRAHAA